MCTYSLDRFVCDVEKEYYQEETPFDRGAFGEVYKGERKSDHLKVAIKVLSSDYLQKNEDFEFDFLANQKNLIREINILANLDHPFCLNLVNFSLSPQPIIITPFMSHGNIFNLIKKQDPKLSTQKLCSIYAICSTMDFLHKAGIIHRDFKPQNIFMNENNDICIADFGTSRKVDENCKITLAQIGTPLYMAPELIACDYYTNSVDVYSFGVIYYQFFSDKTKLDDKKAPPKNARSFLNRIAGGARLIRPDNMTDNQWKVYTDCTNQNPDERPSFQQLAERFETDESIWLDGINKEQFMQYIERCKVINEQAKAKHKNFTLQINADSTNTSPPSLNLPRSTRIASSPKAKRKVPIKHISYE